MAELTLVQGLMAASTGISALSAIQSGKQQELAYKMQADAQDQALKDRELIRLQNLRRAQSSQRAYWASRGISGFEGSAAVIAQQSRLGYQLDAGADLSSTGREIQSLASKGSAARSSSYWKAGSSLLSGGVDYLNTRK
jgi:hypothetical protein